MIPRKRPDTPQGIHIGTFKTENGNTVQIFTSSSSSKKQSSTKTKTRSSSSSSKKTPKIEKEAPTSRAKEVEDYLLREVYFAQSKEPRKTRPSDVHYTVGQVVKHKMDGYHGVVIGWDPVAKVGGTTNSNTDITFLCFRHLNGGLIDFMGRKGR